MYADHVQSYSCSLMKKYFIHTHMHMQTPTQVRGVVTKVLPPVVEGPQATIPQVARKNRNLWTPLLQWARKTGDCRVRERAVEAVLYTPDLFLLFPPSLSPSPSLLLLPPSLFSSSLPVMLEARGLPPHLLGALGSKMHYMLQKSMTSSLSSSNSEGRGGGRQKNQG